MPGKRRCDAPDSAAVTARGGRPEPERHRRLSTEQVPVPPTMDPMSSSVDAGLRQLVRDHRDEITEAARRHHAIRVRLFGSVARGEDHPGSDIDLLVDFETGSSLFDLLHLQGELESLLGHHVDVVSAGGLKPRDGRILEEAVDL